MTNLLKLFGLTCILTLSVVFIGGKFAWGIFTLVFFFFLAGYVLGHLFEKGLVLLLWHSRNEFTSGEKVHFNLVLSNLGIGFVPWLRMDMELPEKLSGRKEKGKILFLGPLSKINANYDFQAKYKGFYRFENVKVHFSDVFNLFRWSKNFDDSYSFIVKPRLKRLVGLRGKVRQPFGKFRSKNVAFEDLSSIKDIRKYQVGDSLKKMHWKISAHRGELYIREPEASGSTELILMLDLFGESYRGIPGEERVDTSEIEIRYLWEEACAECIAAIVYSGFKDGKNVRFHYYTNELNSARLEVEKGMEPVLELLASLEGNSTYPVSEFMKYECGRFGSQSEILIVTNDLSKTMESDILSNRYSNITVLSRRGNYSRELMSRLTETGLILKHFRVEEDAIIIGDMEIEK